MLKLLIATVLMLKLQLKLLPKTHLKLRHNLSDKQKSLKLFSIRWKAAFFFYTPLPSPFAQQMQRFMSATIAEGTNCGSEEKLWEN